MFDIQQENYADLSPAVRAVMDIEKAERLQKLQAKLMLGLKTEEVTQEPRQMYDPLQRPLQPVQVNEII